MKMYAEYHNQMTLKEKIEETLCCILFGIFFFCMIFMVSLSDAIDQSIIEARQASSTTQQ